MAQAKTAKVAKTTYAHTGAVVTNSNAPAISSLPANTLAALGGSVKATIAQQLTLPSTPTGARQVGMVNFINGYPNGQAVPGMQALIINGAPFTGNIAHTNPVAKAYAAGKPQATNVPAFKQQGVIVQWGKKQAPMVSSNPTNQLFANAVAAHLVANGGSATLGALANACAHAGGQASVPNVTPWLVTHAFKRMGWLTAV
jgi:hypothetical protein